MKIQTVYKVTTKGCHSCLMAYKKTPIEVKNLLCLTYSTLTWTLPNINLEGSGCFVFCSLDDARDFIKLVKVDDQLICWEALAGNVRPKGSYIPLGSRSTVERLKMFWSKLWVKSKFRTPKQKFYIADAVKLVKVVDPYDAA